MANPSQKPKKRTGKQPTSASPNRTAIALLLVAAAVALILIGKGMLSRDSINPSDPPETQLNQALDQKRVVYALFHSTDCIPCKQMEKTAAEVMPAYKNRIVFVDVNIYDPINAALLRRMGLRVIPTNYIFDRTGQYKRIEGAIPADILRAELDAALSR
ncbi:MAG: thioredoxin family protein [Anaerolineae bacterium]